MARLKEGSRADLLVMLALFVFALAFWPVIRVEGNLRCDDKFLNTRCKNLFTGGSVSACRGDALQIFPKCLFMASECKRNGQITKTVYTHSANFNYSNTYDKLAKKVKSYKLCFSRRSSRTCNESMIQNCYENFVQNSTKSCKEVHKLRFCILMLRPIGCHEMRNPWYTLAVGIIKNYRACFIQNYTILLEALQQRRATTVNLSDDARNRTEPVTTECKSGVRKANYMLFGAMLIFVLLAFGLLTLLVCIKRGGLPLKGRRSVLNSRLPQNSGNAEPLRSGTCVTSGPIPLTYAIRDDDDDDVPPPYYAETSGLFAAAIDSPPPYTSRPTSVNGDFV